MSIALLTAQRGIPRIPQSRQTSISWRPTPSCLYSSHSGMYSSSCHQNSGVLVSFLCFDDTILITHTTRTTTSTCLSSPMGPKNDPKTTSRTRGFSKVHSGKVETSVPKMTQNSDRISHIPEISGISAEMWWNASLYGHAKLIIYTCIYIYVCNIISIIKITIKN